MIRYPRSRPDDSRPALCDRKGREVQRQEAERPAQPALRSGCWSLVEGTRRLVRGVQEMAELIQVGGLQVEQAGGQGVDQPEELSQRGDSSQEAVLRGVVPD